MLFLETSPFGIWLVALAIIAADSIVFIKPQAFTYVFQRDGRVKISVIENAYLLRGMQPILTLAKYPFQPFFVGELGEQDVSAASRDARRRRRDIANLCLPFRFFAANAFILVCLAGPALSWFLGLGAAILVVWALIYLNAFVALAFALHRKAELVLSTSALAMIAVELVVCPFLAANLVKKIVGKEPLTQFERSELDGKLPSND